MFQLMQQISQLDLARRQAPCLAVAFVIASMTYKWGNFALECAGFLATWFVLDAVYGMVVALAGRHQRAVETTGG